MHITNPICKIPRLDNTFENDYHFQYEFRLQYKAPETYPGLP